MYRSTGISTFQPGSLSTLRNAGVIALSAPCTGQEAPCPPWIERDHSGHHIPAVIKRYRRASGLKVQGPPPRYTDYLFEFRMISGKTETRGGAISFQPVVQCLPCDADPSNSAFIDGGKPESGQDLKNCDQLGKRLPWKERQASWNSLSPNFRPLPQRGDAQTLAFCTTSRRAGPVHWSVDNRQGYGGWFSTDWANWAEIGRYHPLPFPPFRI